MEKSLDIANISETIIDLIDDDILVCDMDGRIIFSNRAIQSYLGYDDEELKGKGLIDIIAEIHKSKAESFLRGISDVPSEREEFLFHGRNNLLKLHLRAFHKNQMIYLHGNQKYVEYERIRKKLEVEIANAIKIHERSLPVSFPETENISFASMYIPAEELGGDLFDVIRVDNGLLNDYFEQYVCFIADVSGHGLDSAMLSIYVKDTIRSFFSLKHIPGQLLSPKEIMHFFVEQYKKEGYPEEYLVCLLIISFDLKTRELTYCNAGLHTCPLLVRDEENIIELNKAGLPISTAFDANLLKYEDTSLRLYPTMTLFIMSDGLPEQRSDHEVYEDRLRRLIPEIYFHKPDHIIRRIHEDFIDFLQYEKIKDDITLVVVKLLQRLI